VTDFTRRHPDQAASVLEPIVPNVSTAEIVEARLILAISLGEKKPGEKIIESEIADALGVSRIPVREAMQKLQLRGILVNNGRRSLKVLDHTPQSVAELFELRLAVERIVMTHAMALPDKSALHADLEAIIRQMTQLADSRDPVALSACDLEFHRAIVRHSGNGLAAQVWEGLAQHMQIVFCRDWAADRKQQRMAEVAVHHSLADYIIGGDPTQMESVLQEHYFSAAARA
jgi:DNA-binding GntR family transcriptional regulator